MIPYPYNMVDMGGIDLAEANGTVVEGLYAKIVEAVNACGDTVLYNWKFAGIEIAPQHTQILLGSGELRINTLIQVTEHDAVTVLGLPPAPPPIVPVSPLVVSENGIYNAVPPASGFNPVTVAVPSKILVPLSVTESGEYDPSDYDADGFSQVSVNVSGAQQVEIDSWDFTDENPLVSKNGLTATQYNVEFQSDGAHFYQDGSRIVLPSSLLSALNSYLLVDIAVEVKSMQLQSGRNRRFIILNSTTNGLVYKESGVWTFYNGYWNDSVVQLAEYSDASFNLRRVINSWMPYINGDPILSNPVTQSINTIMLGSSDQSINNAIISSIALYGYNINF